MTAVRLGATSPSKRIVSGGGSEVGDFEIVGGRGGVRHHFGEFELGLSLGGEKGGAEDGV